MKTENRKRNVVRLTESQLRQMIAESVKRTLMESSVATRGTNYESGGVYVSPFDDNDYGDTTYNYSTGENKYIEKYAQTIADRIDKVLRRNGANCHIDVHEDIDNDTQYYTTERTLVFDIEWWNGMTQIKTYKVYSLVSKIIGNMEMVRYFNINSDVLPHGGHLIVTAVVEADKNGVEELPKSPRYNNNRGDRLSANSHYKKPDNY